MNKKEWVEKLSLAKDEYVYESDIKKPKRRSRVPIGTLSLVAASLAIFTVIGVWLFKPYDTSPPDVSEYSDSEYYPIIEKINLVTFTPPKYKNNFSYFINSFFRAIVNLIPGGTSNDGDMAGGSATPEDGGSGEYVEVTDNQFAGVTEPDRIKRTSTHIFFIQNNYLCAYSIDGENTALVGEYAIRIQSSLADEIEFFLSEDGDTATVIVPERAWSGEGSTVRLLTLDVSDPTSITELNRATVTGEYVTSRYKDGFMMLVGTQVLNKNKIDYDNPETFLPKYSTANSEFYVAMDNITVPEKITYLRYTTVYMINADTLELGDSAACLSYSATVTVSPNNVFLMNSYNDVTNESGQRIHESKTDITVISYESGELSDNRSVTVSGSINDRFSIDEYNGTMRVVTSTVKAVYDVLTENDNVSLRPIERIQSASLYCFDLSTLTRLASVENFAPDGESVRSARFDGDSAYVCTSIMLQDPVFFFDLSDLSNVKMKDTGTIPGFSTSLITFGDGLLLGIGRGERWDSTKVELYAEGESSVDSICIYELDDSMYSTEYKSYYINRDEQLFGFACYDYSGENGTSNAYILLHFNGYGFIEVARVDLERSALNSNRAVLIDGYLYVFSERAFDVVPVVIQ